MGLTCLCADVQTASYNTENVQGFNYSRTYQISVLHPRKSGTVHERVSPAGHSFLKLRLLNRKPVNLYDFAKKPLTEER